MVHLRPLEAAAPAGSGKWKNFSQAAGMVATGMVAAEWCGQWNGWNGGRNGGRRYGGRSWNGGRHWKVVPPLQRWPPVFVVV